MNNPGSAMKAERTYRILRVITWLPPGGIEQKLVASLPLLNRPPFEVQVVCIRERGVLAGELEKAGIPVHLVPFRSRLDLRGLRGLRDLIVREKIDLVHSHMYRANTPATLAARWAGVRAVVGQLHNVSTWETARQLWMDRILSRCRAATICVSKMVQREAQRRLYLPPARLPVIYNGVDVERFRRREAGAQLRRSLGLDPLHVVIGMFARLVPQKNPVGFIEAAQSLLPDFPDARFVLVGDGSLRPQLERKIQDSGLVGKVILTGHRQDVPELLSACDIFCLPSLREGFSNAVLEALAAGLPLVVTHVGGNSEAVEEGRSGLIIPPGRPDALVGALGWLIGHPDERAKMGREAARRAELFSLDKMIGDLQRLYLQLLESGPASFSD
ncbi:MAG: glycosyltransferase [bacterium]